MNPVEYVGMAGGAIGLSLSVPQSLRIRKTGHTDGVSFLTWAVFYLVYASWLAYGFRTSLPSQIFTNSLAFLFATPLVAWLLKDRHPHLSKTQQLTLQTLIPAGAFTTIWTAPLPIVDIILTSYCLVRLPQVVASWQNRTNIEPSNVSMTTWIMSLISSLIWLTYATLLRTEPVLYVTNSLNTLFSIAVISLELYRRRIQRQ
jgi:uncharacterized protein with PQ loop repeat